MLDLRSLPTTHPDVYQQMLEGFFSFAKTKCPFSRMVLDHFHEQHNKIIKGVGGATSIFNTQDEFVLIRWETCGPEVARIVSEFEDSLHNQDASSSATKHHEKNVKISQKFNRDVESVYQAIPCNPFEMASLSTINKSTPFPQSVSDQLKQVLSTGEKQVKVFIQDRLLMQRTAITEKISKNKFLLLTIGSSKGTSINLEVPFMNKLRSAVEHRPARVDDLYGEDLYGIPNCTSVGCTDEIYHGSKSSIRLASCQQPIMSETYQNGIIVEASPILCKLSNVSADNFYEFVVVFYNYVIRLAEGFDRLNVVFDRYFKNSLKV